MTMMDERVAERRRGVSEDRARRRLRWVLGTIAVVLVAVGAIWLIRSPVLSIASVTVTGNTMSNPDAYVDELGMGIGVPTIDVRAGAIASCPRRRPRKDGRGRRDERRGRRAGASVDRRPNPRRRRRNTRGRGTGAMEQPS